MLLLFGMVDIETVLVLGAGSSQAFGFPTGKQLVRDIYSMLDGELGGFREHFWEATKHSSVDTVNFIKVLKDANPLSIDSWLEHNPDYIEVGKIAIAIALLYKEKQSNLRPENNWYQLLFKRLNSPFEDFSKNKLSIITFNYDRSLEQYLFGTFRNTHTEKTEEECRNKLNHLRIHHIYGALGRLDWQSESQLPLVTYGQSIEYNTILSAASGIKIIPRKTTPEAFSGGVRKPKFHEFNEVRTWISNANAIYFLGFGYDQTNMERLGIEILKKPQKKMGTAKGLGHQEYQEVLRMNIFTMFAKDCLLDKTVYEFLHGHVDFNSL